MLSLHSEDKCFDLIFFQGFVKTGQIETGQSCIIETALCIAEVDEGFPQILPIFVLAFD